MSAAAPLLRIADRGIAALPALLAGRIGTPPVVDPRQLAVVPVLVSPAYCDRLTRLNRLLDRALRAIVDRYFDDPRIRAVYALPEPLEAILRRAHGRPYRVGWHRPDLVHDADGQPRVCEIGARYPLNGWMVSQRIADAVAPHATELGTPTGHGFLEALCAGYRPGETVAMVHAREAGTEIFLLAELLRERGIGFVGVAPDVLTLANGALAANRRRIDHVILEMDRSELPLLSDAVLDHLIERGSYFNDVRTLILVHDKRVLAVLWDEAIRHDLLPAAEAEALRGFLIPSWTVADAAGCAALLARHGNLIAKRSSGGRGIDALVRAECDAATWAGRVERDWSRDVYQAYLTQYDFAPPGAARPVHLVGLQLCRDATSYGPGIFRASDASVINLHGDRGLIHVPLATP